MEKSPKESPHFILKLADLDLLACLNLGGKGSDGWIWARENLRENFKTAVGFQPKEVVISLSYIKLVSNWQILDL